MEIWYVAYGSNMCADRIRCYLQGGTPRGGRRSQRGCRDAALPTREVATTLPHPLLFAGPSRVWHGGPAFLDIVAPGRTHARAWLLAHGQLEDLLAQENGLPLGAVTLSPGILREGGVVAASGRYGRLVPVDSPDHRPAVTFTYVRRPRPRAPDPAYVRLIAAGLEEAGHSGPAVADYLGRQLG